MTSQRVQTFSHDTNIYVFLLARQSGGLIWYLATQVTQQPYYNVMKTLWKCYENIFLKRYYNVKVYGFFNVIITFAKNILS
jgi:hypothetical protein